MKNDHMAELALRRSLTSELADTFNASIGAFNRYVVHLQSHGGLYCKGCADCMLRRYEMLDTKAAYDQAANRMMMA